MEPHRYRFRRRVKGKFVGYFSDMLFSKREAEMRFHAINVNYPLFAGQEAGTQRVLYVDLSRVAHAKVQNLSPAKTALVTCGTVFAGANAVLGLVILALFSGAQ